MCLPDILSDIMSLYARRLSLQLIVVCSIINGENFVLVFWKYWTLFLNSKLNYSLTSLQKLFLKSFCNFLDTFRRICCSFSCTLKLFLFLKLYILYIDTVWNMLLQTNKSLKCIFHFFLRKIQSTRYCSIQLLLC